MCEECHLYFISKTVKRKANIHLHESVILLYNSAWNNFYVAKGLASFSDLHRVEYKLIHKAYVTSFH